MRKSRIEFLGQGDVGYSNSERIEEYVEIYGISNV